MATAPAKNSTPKMIITHFSTVMTALLAMRIDAD